ncbi:MAG: winged helix-turn-helix transcriptional regulator, partial [Lachnospiraceae bacterium]|nr:winged helix-turn-helix transcriptional regulator [Lachnospiraceae bacterium]
EKVSERVPEKVSEKVSERVPEKVPEGVSERVPEKVSEKEQQLLMILTEAPGSTKAVLAGKMGVSRKTMGTYLKSLKDKGIIARIGSARKGYWQIRMP